MVDLGNGSAAGVPGGSLLTSEHPKLLPSKPARSQGPWVPASLQEAQRPVLHQHTPRLPGPLIPSPPLHPSSSNALPRTALRVSRFLCCCIEMFRCAWLQLHFQHLCIQTCQSCQQDKGLLLNMTFFRRQLCRERKNARNEALYPAEGNGMVEGGLQPLERPSLGFALLGSSIQDASRGSPE